VSSSTGSIKIDVTVGRISAAVAAVAALVAGAFVVPAVTGGSGSSCNTTSDERESVSSALSSATAGSTICLNAATNWTFNATVSKSSMTKVTLASGVTQSQVTDLDAGHERVEQPVVRRDDDRDVQSSIDTGSTNIKVTNVKLTGAVCIQAQTTSSNILLDGLNVTNVGQSCTEGSIGIQGSSSGNAGITISNSEFTGGESDAIQPTNGAKGITIGPGNYFHDKSGCATVHCDAIQPYGASNITVTGNYFRHNDGSFSDFDCRGSDGLVFTDNVIERGDSAQAAIAISGATTATISHNTLGYECCPASGTAAA
jgi:hypothetical protein